MKRTKSMVIFLGAMILAGMVGTVRAADQEPTAQSGQQAPMMRCQGNFDAMDSNHDGVVTHQEFMSARHPGGHGEEVFKSRDTNGDGKLTKEEFCAGKGMGKGMGKGPKQ